MTYKRRKQKIISPYFLEFLQKSLRTNPSCEFISWTKGKNDSVSEIDEPLILFCHV